MPAHPATAKKFSLLLAKGGSLPGVYGQAFLIRPKGQKRTWVAIGVLTGLDQRRWTSLQKAAALDQLLVALVTSPAARKKAAAALGRG